MPNGKPIATDLQVLDGFAEPFIVDDVPRDERMAQKWGVSIKQVYEVWNKKRFTHLIDYGVSLRAGWLTQDGIDKLEKLRAKLE